MLYRSISWFGYFLILGCIPYIHAQCPQLIHPFPTVSYQFRKKTPSLSCWRNTFLAAVQFLSLGFFLSDKRYFDELFILVIHLRNE
jgi:hypothetical protein